MSSKRVLANTHDFMGERQGTLVIGDYTRRYPVPTWSAKCERCGCDQTVSHQTLLANGAVCKSASCGKQALREALNDTPRKAREREEAAEKAKRKAREDADAAKLKEVEATLTENARKMHAIRRDTLLNKRDVDVYVDPATLKVSMSQVEAKTFNRKAVEEFISKHPEHAATLRENLEVIGSYMDRNGVQIVSFLTLEAAFNRLLENGIIVAVPPAVAPAKTPRVEPTAAPVNLQIEATKPTERTGGAYGRNPQTGEQRWYSDFEISKLSADDYRRAFRTAVTVAEMFSS